MTCAVADVLTFAAGAVFGAFITVAGIMGAVVWAYRKGARGF